MLTIFTPTYNRAYILPKLYDSLVIQENKDFEWLVVDDGSSDGTEDLMQKIIRDNKLNIRYYKQNNGGKHRAINYGVQLAKGDWFFIVDSDDYLPPDSINATARYICQVEKESQYAGVAGSRCYPDGSKVGGEVEYDILDTDSVAFRERYMIKGDMAEVWRTSLLKEYPFPEFEGERFITEAIVWNEIAKKYKLRYFNHNIYVCEYLLDGLTKNIRRHHRKSACGSMLTYSSVMSDKRFRLVTRLKSGINYWRYTINYKLDRSGKFAPVWWSYLLYPLGLFFYLKDSKQ